MNAKRPNAEDLKEQLEALRPAIDFILEILEKGGQPDDNYYALAYEARHRLGRVVSQLGIPVGGGLPRHIAREWARKEINKRIDMILEGEVVGEVIDDTAERDVTNHQ